jgi:hypothetical protein
MENFTICEKCLRYYPSPWLEKYKGQFSIESQHHELLKCCDNYFSTKTDFVTGKIIENHVLCKDVNKDGNCAFYLESNYRKIIKGE